MSLASPRGRVLLVDDSPLVVDVLQAALQTEGYEVFAAMRCPEALQLVSRAQPDVVVSDLHMPDMDGVAFLHALRKLDPHIPLIMVSSEESVSVILNAVHAGVYDYVPKNGDTRVLVAAVTRAATFVRTLRDNQRLSDELRDANQDLEQRVLERTAQVSAANEELQKLTGQLVASERLAAIGMLAAGIAHEINNPLSYIMSNMTFARMRLAEIEQGMAGMAEPPADLAVVQELQQALLEAEDGASRITDIVKDMRTMSRTDDKSRAKFDINAAIRSATRIAGEQIRRKAQLKVDLAPNLEVIGSAGRMTQVLLNLLVNAAQALEDAPGRDHQIHVVSHRQGDSVIVRVQDSGPGMSAETQAQLFQPFFTTKPEGRGTGLGLSISQDIVRRHGGQINVESQLGVGTSFIVELPAAPPGHLHAFTTTSKVR